MTIATTTMSSLLSAVKATLLGYQSTTLSKINTFQRGCLPPAAVFPALAILPVRETFTYGFTNSKYEVERELVIEIYDLKLDTKTSKDNTIDLVKAVKDIFATNFEFSDTSYFSNWGYESYGETISINRGFLFNSYISLICKSRGNYGSMTIYNNIENNPSVVTLQNAIVTLLKANKSVQYSTVETIVDSPISPIPGFPAILVGAGSRSRVQNYPNATISDISFDIGVMSQLFHKETSLNHNLSIVEGVKNVLQSDYTIGGRCEFSNINYISYDQEKVPSGFIYNTVLTLGCRTREF